MNFQSTVGDTIETPYPISYTNGVFNANGVPQQILDALALQDKLESVLE